MKKKAIVLLSGGIDSAVVLFYAREKKFDCTCLTFMYGQKHKREIQSAQKIALAAGFPLYLINLDMPEGASALTSEFKHISDAGEKTIGRKIPSTYVPARNIIFLSLALCWAEVKRCTHIFIGANSIDYSGYPDCRSSFLKAFQKAAQLGTKMGIEGRPAKISAPLLFKNKAQIIKLAAGLNVPLELTWSCYRGGKSICNKCESCILRAKGFKEAGIIDPLAGGRR